MLGLHKGVRRGGVALMKLMGWSTDELIGAGGSGESDESQGCQPETYARLYEVQYWTL
jgi:hypothetical protein